MNRLIGLVLCLLAFAPPAWAQNTYDGMWWDTSRSGMGVQVAHQGTGAFVTWFAYDGAGHPIWYAMSGTFSNGRLDGTLYSYTASPFSSNYTPTGIAATAAGAGILIFTTANAGVLHYAITTTGSTGSLNLTRYNVALPDASGLYGGIAWPQSGTCSGSAYAAVYTVVQSGAVFTMTEDSASAACSFSGVVTQNGAKLSIVGGAFTCTNGNRGTVGSNEITITPRSFTIAGTITYTAPVSCTLTGVLGGIK